MYKFRAYDFKQSKMFYPQDEEYFCFYSNGNWSLFGGENDCVITSNNYEDLYDGLLMPTIGWKDKNGTEIYFWDVIKYTATLLDSDFNVEFKEEGTGIVTRGVNGGACILRSIDEDKSNTYHKIVYADKEGAMGEFWDDDEFFDIEIIGNIFENPFYLFLKN